MSKEKDTICPLLNKICKKVREKYNCPGWTKVRGKDPQSEQEFDRWDCTIRWIPTLLLEVAQQSRQTGAAVESFRNSTVAQHDVLGRMLLMAGKVKIQEEPREIGPVYIEKDWR